MNLDSSFKRHFTVIVGALIAIAAYFQASGLSSLLAEVALDHPRPRPRPGPRPSMPGRPARPGHHGSPEDADHATSADPILARNPFDSVTGPLFPQAPVSEEVAPGARSGDPYSDPICEGGRLLLIVDSGDPAWSFATIAVAGQVPLLRRTGDPVFGRSVSAIAWDRIWLAWPDGRCQLRLGDHLAPPPPPPAAVTPRPAPTPGKKRSRGALPPEIAAKIRQVGEREFVIERSAVDAILGNQEELMRSARVAPVTDGERVTGVKLMRIQPDSLLGSLGMKNGDELRAINGFDITDPQKALEAYARLQTSENLSLALQRGGQDTTVDIHIR